MQQLNKNNVKNSEPLPQARNTATATIKYPPSLLANGTRHNAISWKLRNNRVAQKYTTKVT